MKLCILCGKHLKAFKSTNVDWKLRETHKQCFKNDVYATQKFKESIRKKNSDLIKQDNENQGNENEKRLLKVFKTMKPFKEVYMTKPRYQYDYQDDKNKYMIEVKKRNCYRDTYDYIKISFSKFKFMVNKINGKEWERVNGRWINLLKKNKKQFKLYQGIFVFSFFDGDYFCYIDELDKKGINKNCYILRNHKARNDRDTKDYKDKRTDCLFISKTILKPIGVLRKRKFQKK